MTEDDITREVPQLGHRGWTAVDPRRAIPLVPTVQGIHFILLGTKELTRPVDPSDLHRVSLRIYNTTTVTRRSEGTT